MPTFSAKVAPIFCISMGAFPAPIFLPERFVVTKSDPGAKPRYLTPKQWAEAEALWESDTVTIDDLVKKFHRARTTFERHFAKHKITRGAKVAVAKKRVEEVIVKAAVDDAMILSARVRETKEDHYKMASGIAKLIWREILNTEKAGSPMAVALNNIKALKEAATGLKAVREERWAVLGLDRPDAVDPDELPELVISELTANQVQELRDRDHTELELDGDIVDIGDDDEDGVVEEGA